MFYLRSQKCYGCGLCMPGLTTFTHNSHTSFTKNKLLVCTGLDSKNRYRLLHLFNEISPFIIQVYNVHSHPHTGSFSLSATQSPKLCFCQREQMMHDPCMSLAGTLWFHNTHVHTPNNAVYAVHEIKLACAVASSFFLVSHCSIFFFTVINSRRIHIVRIGFC